MAWAITIGLKPTMGVAWHRFLAFPNIWFKRHAHGRTSLGALQPISLKARCSTSRTSTSSTRRRARRRRGRELHLKGLLDFSTCTECGRCQSQCPAWNTEKPLSPKLMILALRDHAHAKAPWLQASEEARKAAATAIPGSADPSAPTRVAWRRPAAVRAAADRRHRLRPGRPARPTRRPAG